jgi:uncharacterized membrane protein
MAVLRRAFVAASVLWALALPLATWIASRPHPTVPLYAVALAVYGTGSLVCHQLHARSFQLWTAQMPVCARCTGIYLGGALAAIATSVGRYASARTPSRAVVLAAALPTAATLLYEWSTGATPSNVVRAAAGLPLGVVVAWIVARSG